MLEQLAVRNIEKLRTVPGTPLTEFVVTGLPKGSLIRAITKSGNCYLFEFVKPNFGMAHVIRCDYRPAAPATGYCGYGKVTPEFRISEVIHHAGGRTSPVLTLDLVAAPA